MHDLDSLQCVGISKRELLERLGGPNVLLNLAYSIHPPLLLKFERRIFCDLDPSEIFYWMTKMEVGQSYHHEFWTIGLNVYGDDCQLPKLPTVAASLSEARSTASRGDQRLASHREAATAARLRWKTFYPLVDTKLFRPQPRPRSPKFTTVGQWYWGGAVEVAGEFPDLSKRFAFEPYLSLPARMPEARFELAMNIAAEDPERERLRGLGWQIVDPHRVAHTPGVYRRYLASALAEFTAIKGVDVAWRTGWVSDRAAAFLALGRPVITEDTGALRYLSAENGFRFVRSASEAAAAVGQVLHDWSRLSKQARQCAVEVFDSVKNLRRILDF
jgi:glycosyltransferase involved in cell wall biosynthesis